MSSVGFEPAAEREEEEAMVRREERKVEVTLDREREESIRRGRGAAS